MRSSWADSVESSTAGAPIATSHPSYIPPYLHNRPAGADPPADGPARIPQASGYDSPLGGGGGWNNRTDGWDHGRDREVNPFVEDEANKAANETIFDAENTRINFDAYEDIPVKTSGENAPPPVNTFVNIDMRDALNENIRRCKYVRPTPVQRHAIPISLGGRDLMACAQTGSGKTVAVCFPIISGILKGQFV